VPRDQCPTPDDAHELERQNDAGRRLERRRQREAECAQLFFDPSHGEPAKCT